MASSSENDKKDVFLSYNWESKPSVLKLYRQLTEVNGLRCWLDEFDMGSGALNDRK